MKNISKTTLCSLVFVLISAGLYTRGLHADETVHSNTNVSGVRTVKDDRELNSESYQQSYQIQTTENDSGEIEFNVIPINNSAQKTANQELSPYEAMELDRIEYRKETGKITQTEANMRQDRLVSTESVIKF